MDQIYIIYLIDCESPSIWDELFSEQHEGQIGQHNAEEVESQM